MNSDINNYVRYEYDGKNLTRKHKWLFLLCQGKAIRAWSDPDLVLERFFHHCLYRTPVMCAYNIKDVCFNQDKKNYICVGLEWWGGSKKEWRVARVQIRIRISLSCWISIFSCKIFLNFWSSKPWIRIWIRNKKKCWIRIRIKSMWIPNSGCS